MYEKTFFLSPIGVLNSNMNMSDSLSPLGSPIVLQRKGSVYGANVPMITGKYTHIQLLKMNIIPLVYNYYVNRVSSKRDKIP